MNPLRPEGRKRISLNPEERVLERRKTCLNIDMIHSF